VFVQSATRSLFTCNVNHELDQVPHAARLVHPCSDLAPRDPSLLGGGLV